MARLSLNRLESLAWNLPGKALKTRAGRDRFCRETGIDPQPPALRSRPPPMNKYFRNFLLNSRFPVLAEWGTKDLRRKHIKRHQARQQEVFTKLFGDESRVIVLNGPFRGMRYLNESVWGSITPKWIGSYEHELWPVISKILARSYRRIIDVGCAEGYYAVGLARAFPEADVFAYDLDPVSRAQATRLWELNGKPGAFHLERWCDHEALNEKSGPESLIVCDIEGGEMKLLDPARCATLAETDVLVEVHQTGKAGVKENAAILEARFCETHRIVQVWTTTEIPPLENVDALDEEALLKACQEGRPYPQVWLWMSPFSSVY